MHLKYMGSKSWLAPHLDRLLGDVRCCTHPSSVPESWSTTLPGGARAWRCADTFEPVVNLHRCYLRRDPVSLARLVGRDVDRRFYFRRLLPGALRGPAGRRAACAHALLRNSFSGKQGSFARQQQPMPPSCVRRLQQPPSNVTVRQQDALAYLRALPRPAPQQCIYADPPYIFPGRTMNYYGTKTGHDLAFHSELRDALFASGLPFVVSVNDVPEARELYSGADSITSLSSGKNGSKPELLVLHRGNPVASAGLTGAILLPAQSAGLTGAILCPAQD